MSLWYWQTSWVCEIYIKIVPLLFQTTLLLPHWGSYIFVKFFFFEISVSEHSEWPNCKTSKNVIFSWRPDVCVCTICVCVGFSTFQSPTTHKRLEISIWNLVHQWSSHSPLIVTIFIRIHGRFVILWEFEFFEKYTW